MRTFRSQSSSIAAIALLAVACGGNKKAPPPLASVGLPSGAQLKPFSPSNPSRSGPSAMAALGDKVYIALSNVDANYGPGGPGLVAGLVPSTGAQSIVDLGGPDEHQCTNTGHIAADGSKLYLSCSGSFSDNSGRGVVEVDPSGAGSVSRRAVVPSGFAPGALAVAPGKIWIGDVNSASLISIDRGSFTVADGGVAHPAIQLPCTAAYTYVSSLAVVKGNPVLVGGQPIALTAAGDGRIAVVNSTSGDVALVTVSPSGMTATRSPLPSSSDLEDVAARNQFLYVVSAATQTVVKVDLSAPGDSRSSTRGASAPTPTRPAS